MDIDKACDAFMLMVQNQQYAKAHETLEKQWLELKKIDKDHALILKGLINGATSFEIKRRGRALESALKIWNVYLKYKPLILQVQTPHTNKYLQCADLLEETYKKVFES